MRCKDTLFFYSYQFYIVLFMYSYLFSYQKFVQYESKNVRNESSFFALFINKIIMFIIFAKIFSIINAILREKRF